MRYPVSRNKSFTERLIYKITVSTDSAIKKTNYKTATCRNLRQLAIFHDILPYSAKSTKFYQVLPGPPPKSYSTLYMY